MEEPQYNTETIREYLRHQDSTWSQRIMQWYRDEFQANPTCRSEAETAICLLYKRAGYPPPSRFVWFRSPFDLVSSLHFEIETEHIPRSENLNSFKVVMIARIAEAENASVFYTPLSLHPKTPRWYEQFKSEVVKAWMKSPYIDSFQELYGFEYHWGSTILMALEDSIHYTKHSIGSYLEEENTFIPFWLSFVVSPDWIDYVLLFEHIAEFFSKPELLQNAEPIQRVIQTCDWIIATEEVCFVSEKHIIAHHDEAGKLHSDNGLALEYADGWGIYALHGMRITAHNYQEMARQETIR